VPDNNSRRIAGIHAQADGIVGAVWLAHDKETDVIELYDACAFKREPLAVMAEGLVARGRWIPIAWHKDAKEFAGNLLNRGCSMLHDPSEVSDAMAEVHSREILERRDTGRFVVVNRLKNWLDEANFLRAEGKVPASGYPLMAATRHAYAQLEYAKRQGKKGQHSMNYADIAII
jgi:hypothetical protein